MPPRRNRNSVPSNRNQRGNRGNRGEFDDVRWLRSTQLTPYRTAEATELLDVMGLLQMSNLEEWYEEVDEDSRIKCVDFLRGWQDEAMCSRLSDGTVVYASNDTISEVFRIRNAGKNAIPSKDKAKFGSWAAGKNHFFSAEDPQTKIMFNNDAFSTQQGYNIKKMKEEYKDRYEWVLKFLTAVLDSKVQEHYAPVVTIRRVIHELRSLANHGLPFFNWASIYGEDLRAKIKNTVGKRYKQTMIGPALIILMKAHQEAGRRAGPRPVSNKQMVTNIELADRLYGEIEQEEAKLCAQLNFPLPQRTAGFRARFYGPNSGLGIESRPQKRRKVSGSVIRDPQLRIRSPPTEQAQESSTSFSSLFVIDEEEEPREFRPSDFAAYAPSDFAASSSSNIAGPSRPRRSTRLASTYGHDQFGNILPPPSPYRSPSQRSPSQRSSSVPILPRSPRVASSFSHSPSPPPRPRRSPSPSLGISIFRSPSPIPYYPSPKWSFSRSPSPFIGSPMPQNASPFHWASTFEGPVPFPTYVPGSPELYTQEEMENIARFEALRPRQPTPDRDAVQQQLYGDPIASVQQQLYGDPIASTSTHPAYAQPHDLGSPQLWQLPFPPLPPFSPHPNVDLENDLEAAMQNMYGPWGGPLWGNWEDMDPRL